MSSACLKAEAVEATLMQRTAALQKKHALRHITYLRLISSNHRAYVAILMGKALVIPLKLMTTPRMVFAATFLVGRRDSMQSEVMQMRLERSLF